MHEDALGNRPIADRKADALILLIDRRFSPLMNLEGSRVLDLGIRRQRATVVQQMLIEGIQEVVARYRDRLGQGPVRDEFGNLRQAGECDILGGLFEIRVLEVNLNGVVIRLAWLHVDVDEADYRVTIPVGEGGDLRIGAARAFRANRAVHATRSDPGPGLSRLAALRSACHPCQVPPF